MALILGSSFSLHTQTAALGGFNGGAGTIQPAQNDSYVQVAAESQGLALVAPADLPRGGTFWWVTPEGITAPFPCPPQDLSVPIYQITDSQFLVDETGGQVTVNPRRLGLQAQTSAATIAAAVVTQADAVVNFINQIQDAQFTREVAAAMGMDFPSLPGGGVGSGDGGSGVGYSGGIQIDTNGLWLEITNVSNGWSYLNLHNGTNQVYAILTKTNLLDANWTIEQVIWPTNGMTIPTVTPFAVQNSGRQILFFRAEDWTGVTENGNTAPDWWLWEYFGTTALSDTNLDVSGNALADDYASGLDPNIITFTVSAGSKNVNAPAILAQLNVSGGQPAYYAIVVKGQTGTNWLPFTAGNVIISLGATDGVYEVSIGLKGPAANGTQTWRDLEFILQQTAPHVTITSPGVNGTVIKPYWQLTGLANEQVTGIRYDLSNAAGTVTNQPGMLLDQFFDTNQWRFTTNYFQCFDVPLASNVNYLTLHLRDLAGNTFTTNFTVTLDYTTATNPPAVTLRWPQAGMLVNGSNCTLRGTMGDETGTVLAQIINGDGTTNLLTGLVERNGDYWLENVTLNGTNQISIQATDAAGNTTTTNFTLLPGGTSLTINAVTGDLWQPTTSVDGTIGDPNAMVFVNGVQAVNNGDGTWSADNVPINGTGTATFDAVAKINGQTVANQSLESEKPPKYFITEYHHTETENNYSAEAFSPYWYWNESFKIQPSDDASSHTTYSGHTTADTTAFMGGIWGHGEKDWSDTGSQDTGYGNGEWGPYDYSTNDPAPGCPTQPDITYSIENSLWTDSLGDYSEKVDYHWKWDDGSTSEVTATAGTKVQLWTGGKSEVNRQNLFCIGAGATGYGKPEEGISGGDWLNTPITNVPTSSVVVGNQSLGNDGNLWLALSKNKNYDMTVTVTDPTIKHFNAWPNGGSTPQEYHPYIGLTTSTVNVNLDTATPEVCVGQTVTIGADWQGGDMPYTSLEDVWWHLPDKYVNQPINYSSTCLTYVKNEDLLTNTAIQCWYVNGDGSVQDCSVRETLHFSNGQSVNIAAAGHFAVYRPSVNKPDPNGPFRAALTGFFLTPMLQLANNPMIYTVTINSKYAGSFGLTQLVKMYSQTIVTALPFFGTGYTTWGNFNLDINTDGSGGGEYYDGPKDISDLCKIDDAPGQTLMTVGGSYNGHWKDYVRFTPNGGIPVTLGRIDWNWAATADWYPLGVGWGISSDGADGPALYPDDNFPLWESQGMFKIYIY